jgi:hypothetical protein
LLEAKQRHNIARCVHFSMPITTLLTKPNSMTLPILFMTPRSLCFLRLKERYDADHVDADGFDDADDTNDADDDDADTDNYDDKDDAGNGSNQADDSDNANDYDGADNDGTNDATADDDEADDDFQGAPVPNQGVRPRH